MTSVPPMLQASLRWPSHGMHIWALQKALQEAKGHLLLVLLTQQAGWWQGGEGGKEGLGKEEEVEGREKGEGRSG